MKPPILVFQPCGVFQRCVLSYIFNNRMYVSQKSVVKADTINKDLEEIIEFKKTNNSSWIVEARVSSLCHKYNLLTKGEKANFLETLALQCGVKHEKIVQLAKRLSIIESANTNHQLISREKTLKDSLTPPYHWLFARVGRLEHGVKFLVDLRANVLELISESSKDADKLICLGQMDATLKELLFLWFSVGFMKIKRITWQTPCDILQKVSDYEAIHPVKNWTDLKKRVGPYRRCFIFTHPSMPREPLVVLHTALCDLIPDSVKGIQDSENRILGKVITNQERLVEDKTKIKAAIFYSIASTQAGLQGIELGNYLIKEVAKYITSEFPMIDQLSSLSPIPNFRIWLLDRMKRDINTVFTKHEQEVIKNDLNYDQTVIATRDLYLDLKKIFNNSLWSNDKKLAATLREPLLRACAWYLYREKRRSYALNNVANFHLRNGAIMWRINWMADPSPRGMANSCGIMVNYRYYLDETETNSRNYIEKYSIKASNSVIHLAKEAEKYFVTSTNNKL